MPGQSEQEFPFQDESLPVEQRVADLVGRMTLEEKIAQLRSRSPAVERLGVPAYSWGGECLHGLVHTGRATIFPQSIGLAATFDTELIERVAGATGTEARAKYHDEAWSSPYIGITFWTPNINIFRDPRWGRGQETYGEDPFLTGRMGAAFIRGLQGDHPRYLKAMGCAKHLAVHSGPEHLRQAFDARTTKKDLHETYLPAFKELIDAGVASVMATYNRVNGEACAGSETLLKEILRGRWDFQGFVTSDAGAIGGMDEHHHVTSTALESAVQALLAGCDMEIGSHCYEELPDAVAQGLVAEEDIDRALKRIYATRFRLGMFDDPEKVPYTDIGKEAIHCPEHVALARETALKSLVLLKNDGVLPLSHDLNTVLVTGPNSIDLDVLLGNFYRGAGKRLISVLEGVVDAA
ncbi:MAG: glycoside hydrolase family 3 N-terminal domain-containing protein, partial [Candidatus Brocadiia bacterium]